MRIDYIIILSDIFHFDLRDFHPPLGPTPIVDFHHHGIVVEFSSKEL
jgi:hypothetical protein